MAVAQALHDTISEFVRREAEANRGETISLAPKQDWAQMLGLGTELWLDTGDVEAIREHGSEEFTAVTTNNTLLNKEIQKGQYDDLIVRAAQAIRDAQPNIADQELVLEIAFVLNAYHGQRLVDLFGKKVSVELHTDLALDMERSVEYGRRYHRINPEQFIVKVPLTPAGYLAARKLGQEGIPINFTLGFSVRQNYLAALLTNPTYCNVFMGRLGAFLSDNKLGNGTGIGERVTLHTQRTLRSLREQGRSKTKLIGASFRNGEQVGALAGLDVYTMPPNVAAEYAKSPLATPTLRLDDEPEVHLTEGHTPMDYGIDKTWTIPDTFRSAVEALLEKDCDTLTPEGLVSHFHGYDLGDFVPVWSVADVTLAKADGKIPVLEHWELRLRNGEIAPDSLLNLAALQSFTTDQEALDGRIRGLLK